LVALLWFGAGAVDASPISLGNAGGFSALAVGDTTPGSGNLVITGNSPILGQQANGVAAPNNIFSVPNLAPSQVYVNSHSTVSSPTGVTQNANIDSYLAQAVTDANSAAAQATALGTSAGATSFPTTVPGGTITATQTTAGTFIYNVGSVLNNGSLTVNAPAGSMIIVNIASIPTNSSVTLSLGPGLLPQNVIWNIQSPTFLNLGGSAHIDGILLAPTTTVVLGGGSVSATGQIIAQTLTLTGGATLVGTGLSPIVIVPEPASLGIVAVATAALFGYRFLRRRKSPG
jgi:hypothetical protein